jgi:hypothetical protein
MYAKSGGHEEVVKVFENIEESSEPKLQQDASSIDKLQKVIVTDIRMPFWSEKSGSEHLVPP